LPPGVLRVPAGGGGMRRVRELVAAGVIRAGRRHDAVPAGGGCPVRGENLLDTTLGAGPRPPRMVPADLREPDLSARYTVPTESVPVDEIESARTLSDAIEGLDLDRSAHKLLVWADSWGSEPLAGLVSLIEAARTAGGGSR
jgi:hypothetical protein